MQAQAFLDRLTADPAEADNLVHVEDLPARDPKPLPFPEDLPEVLVSRLSLLGVEGLFEHQRAGLEVLRSGRNVMLATGTASGKSLVYQIAAAESALVTPKATALFLFPTKALARDQLRAIRGFKLPQIRAGVYDGDTPQAERPLIRRNANLVLTNPDMLHLALLADHARWADFMLRLAVVVVDEAHVLRGVFGSHVAMVLRRLRRLIALHGGDPRWCLSSATIGNPGELAERLTGLDIEVIEADAAPRGRKLFAMWNPPIIDDETGARRSTLAEASTVMTKLVDDGARTIGFTRSRRAAELLAEFTRRGVSDARARDRIRAYRAGYLAEDRRKIEQELTDGDLVAVAATNALELGIDIGSLDAAVLTGYPGTRASMWQQAGRAGRRSDESLAVLVAQDDPLDQYLVQHPADLFERPSEAAVIDPTNPYVLEPHLRCAAREYPLTDEETGAFFGPEAADALGRLAEQELVKHRKERWHDIGATPPHRDLDIRAGGGHVYRIVQEDTGQVIGTADEHRAYGTLHPGAIYLHQGEQFLVRGLDHVRRVALVEEADPDYYTQARDITDIVIVNVIDHRPLGDAELCFGDVEVTNQVVGFVRKLVSSNEIIGEEQLALPPVTLRTRAVWWTLPGRLIDGAGVSTKELAGGIHGAEHCAIGLLPLVATCDRWDIGGVSTTLHPDTGLTTIFVYDGYPGGAGIAERGYHAAERWLRATDDRLRDCPCRDGCPSCVVSPKCGNGNEPLDKAAAEALTRTMLDGR
jgi:DEAD/DEAH box helicase domain-containing protein